MLLKKPVPFLTVHMLLFWKSRGIRFQRTISLPQLVYLVLRLHKTLVHSCYNLKVMAGSYERTMLRAVGHMCLGTWITIHGTNNECFYKDLPCKTTMLDWEWYTPASSKPFSGLKKARLQTCTSIVDLIVSIQINSETSSRTYYTIGNNARSN